MYRQNEARNHVSIREISGDFVLPLFAFLEAIGFTKPARLSGPTNTAHKMTELTNGGPEAADATAAERFARLADLITSDDTSDAGEPTEGVSASPRSWGFDIAEINRSYALAIWGGKAVVINEQPHGPVNDRVRVMSVEAMSSWFANRQTEVVGSDGKVKAVSWAKAWHSHRDRRQYDGVEFFPNPDGAPGTPNYLNFWRGFDVTPSPAGSYAIFRDHLLTNVCAGDEKLFNYLFGWIAHIVQKPRERLGTAIVLRGRRGTGKSKVGEVIGSLFSSHYFQVDDARYITGQFNAHMASCLLLQADEAVWAGDKAAEGRLKGLITAEMQMIESKGVDPIRLRNFLRVIMTSNEGWVVPAGMDERRFCVLDVGSGCAQNHAYFCEMDEQLNSGGRERLLHDLLNFDLSKVDLWHIPQTRALLEQKIRSFDPIEDFWYNRLWDGSEWRSRIVCADLYADYLKASTLTGIGRRRSPAEFGARLAKLAPEIRKTRPAIEIEPGVMKRTWCYEMPSLDDCRLALDELLGQTVDWPALSPGEGERAQHEPSDDYAPV